MSGEREIYFLQLYYTYFLGALGSRYLCMINDLLGTTSIIHLPCPVNNKPIPM